MIYHYRWLIASILTLWMGLTGFIYDVLPRYIAWQETKGKCQALQVALQQWQRKDINKNPIKKHHSNAESFRHQSIAETTLLRHLGLLIQRHHLQIHLLQRAASSLNNQRVQFVVALQGGGPDFFAFFQELFDMAHPVSISQVNYRSTSSQQVLLKMNIDIWKEIILTDKHVPSAIKINSHSASLFCDQWKEWSGPFAKPYAQTWSHALETLQWVGVLYDHQQQIGLLKLPTGKVIEVLAGQRIGIERAKIISVKRDHLFLQRVSGEKIELR